MMKKIRKFKVRTIQITWEERASWRMVPTSQRWKCTQWRKCELL